MPTENHRKQTDSESSSQERKLAAILFADIQGYTSLMQSNEQLALSSLQKFKTQLDIQVPQHQGNIINFYGDGCLAIFNSSVDATACAKSLQEVFQTEPKVPVRIGLHAGDVVLRDDNVFGDAVNIASRIESMGVAGSVLLSSTIRNQIKNQEAFDVSPLGKFKFKNVEGEMTVYALTNEGLNIPDKKDIAAAQKATQQKQNRKWLLPAVLIGLVVLVLGGYQLFYNVPASSNTSVEENMMAVFPFEVNGNADIEYLGAGMVDLISTQLDEIPQIKSVDPNRIFNQLGEETSISRKLDKATELALSMGANKFILGSITQFGETLQFSATKYNSSDGQRLDKLNIKQNSNTPITQTVDELIQKLVANEMEGTGQKMESLAAMTSTNLESMKAYLKGEQAFRRADYNVAYELFMEATSLDSTFALAWMRVSDAAVWNLQISGAQARRQWGKYRHTMPKKWQDYYEARQLYSNADRKAVEVYEKLINAYGEDYAFVNGLGEFLYHFNPVYGKSQLEAKPYLEKALELDENNLEVLYHLSDIAIVEKDEERLKQLAKKVDPDSQMYPKMQLSLLHFKDTITDEEVKAIVNHPEFFQESALSASTINKDGVINFDLLDKVLKFYDNEEFKLLLKQFKEGYYGQEKSSFETAKQLNSVKDYFPFPYEQYNRTLPASFMADPAFAPHQEQYAELLKQCEKQDTPWDMYAAIKYAMVLDRKQEIPELYARLKSMGTTPRRSNMVKYYDFSIQAFETSLAGDDDKTLALIDSTFNYNFGWWEIQFSRIDKSIMAANIYAKRGEYEKAINHLEFYIAGALMGEYIAYNDYKLSDWYEQMGDRDKALNRCNIFLEAHQNCDEKYLPWVEEVKQRRDRLMAKEL